MHASTHDDQNTAGAIRTVLRNPRPIALGVRPTDDPTILSSPVPISPSISLSMTRIILSKSLEAVCAANGSLFGSIHFCSRLFVCLIWRWILLHPGKTFHGSERMDSRRRFFGLGPDSPRSLASITEVAQEFTSPTTQPRQVYVEHDGKSVRRPVTRVNPRQQPRSSSPQGGQVGEGVGGDGGSEGPVVDCLRVELEKARNAAKRRPINVEVEECRKFILRSEKPISELDAERAAEVGALDEAEARFLRLEAEQAAVPEVVSERVQDSGGVGHRGSEIARGIGASTRRSQSRSCWPKFHFFQSSAEAANLLQERAAKRRAGVAESVPTNPQDVEGWLSEKHTELRDAIEFGGQRVNFGFDGFDPARRSPVSQFAVHIGQHGRVRIVAHQCGWKGCRVGEACNPGPSQSQELVSDELLDALERCLVVRCECDVEEADCRARGSQGRRVKVQ